MQTTKISVPSHSSSGLNKDHRILPLPTQNAAEGMIFLAHYLDLLLCSIPLALHRAVFSLWLEQPSSSNTTVFIISPSVLMMVITILLL